MNNLQYIVRNDTRTAMHVAVELCENGDFDSVTEAFRWLMRERDDAATGGGECEFTVEYDRDEVERRRKLHEENPLGLFPQDMPKSAWTCSHCGQQFKCHYGQDEDGRLKLLPVPDWMKCCPSCGWRIRKAVNE